MNERDTQFREGFAQLLLEDIEPDLFDIAIHNDPDGARQRIKDKFSQRAYDLAIYFMSNANERMNLNLTSDQVRAWIDLGIPDLKHWDEEEHEQEEAHV